MKTNRQQRERSTVALIAFSLIFIVACFAGQAHASQCVVGQTAEVGTWKNPDSNTGGVTWAVIAEECRTVYHRDCSGSVCTTYSTVEKVFTAQVWAACSPSDCYWGKVDGFYVPIINKFYFPFDHGFASRTVTAKIWSGGDHWLDLDVFTDFDDPSRSDYSWSAWMSRY